MRAAGHQDLHGMITDLKHTVERHVQASVTMARNANGRSGSPSQSNETVGYPLSPHTLHRSMPVGSLKTPPGTATVIVTSPGRHTPTMPLMIPAAAVPSRQSQYNNASSTQVLPGSDGNLLRRSRSSGHLTHSVAPMAGHVTPPAPSSRYHQQQHQQPITHGSYPGTSMAPQAVTPALMIPTVPIGRMA